MSKNKGAFLAFSLTVFSIACRAFAYDITDIQPRSFKRGQACNVRVYVYNSASVNTQFEMQMTSKPSGWTVSPSSKQFWVNATSAGYVDFSVTPSSSGGTGSLGGLLRVNEWGTWRDAVSAAPTVTANEADIGVGALTFAPAKLAPGSHPTSIGFSLKNDGVNDLNGTDIKYTLYISKNSTFDGTAVPVGYLYDTDYTYAGQTSSGLSVTSSELQNFTIPASANGTYYVYWRVEHDYTTLTDPDPSDNTAKYSSTIQIAPSGTLQFKSSTYNVFENAGSVRIYVSRVGGSCGAASVNYSTANGTAYSGSDYSSRSGTLSWSADDASDKYIDIPILGNSTYEGSVPETFSVTLSGATGGSLGSPSVTVISITETELPGTISIYDYDASGGEDTGFIRVIVRRSGGVFGSASVAYSTANGTATAPSDYTAKSGRLTWTDGESGDKSVDIPIIRDSLPEGPENLIFTISDANGASLGTTTTTSLNILDFKGRVRLGSASYSINENAGSLRVYVQRVEGGRGITEVNVNTGNGSATYGTDFTRLSTEGYIRWNDGEIGEKYIDFTIVNDSLNEGDETFTVSLQANMYTYAEISAPISAQVTIVDNDNSATITTVSNPSNGGTTDGGGSKVIGTTCTVSASENSGYTFSNWTEGSTAVSSSMNYSFTVTGNRTLTANFIERQRGILQFKSSTYTVVENAGNVVVTVSRTGGSYGAASVQLATANQTATAGLDYTAGAATLSWADGNAADMTFNIPIINDSEVEGNETFIAVLSNASGASLGSPSTAVITITDDDTYPTIAVSATDALAGESGTGQGTGLFTFTRSGSTASALTVNYSISGTASSGSDYQALGSSVTFAAGATTATKTVTVLDDAVAESDETVVLSLASGAGYTLGSPTSATVTIKDVGASTVSVVPTDAIAGESGTGQGTGLFTFTRSGSTASALAVNYSISGTASSGSDYQALGSSVTFAAGATTATKTVTVLDDSVTESDETVVLSLTSGAGYTLGSPASASVTIKDDDQPPEGYPHPADLDSGWDIVINEVTAYGAAWKQGQHQNINYLTRSGYIWKNGELYHDTQTVALSPDSDAMRWLIGMCAATITSVSLAEENARSPLGTEALCGRAVSNDNTASPDISLTVTPSSMVSAYAVEESLPDGVTPQNIGAGGVWDSANRKVKWGPYFDATSRTLTYEVTGGSGNYVISGTASFDGVGQPISGTSQVTINVVPPSSSTAVRTATNNNTATPDIAVTITPSAGVSSYAVEESLPEGLTPQNIGAGGIWDSANRKVKWGPYFDTTARTLTYEVTGVSGTYLIGGVVSIDGIGQSPSGIIQITINTGGEPLPEDGGTLCGPGDGAALTTAGSFDGYFYSEQAFCGEGSATAVRGTLNVKVTKPAGTLTAKAVLQTGPLNFSAKTWTATEPDGTFRATLAARGGETLDLRVRQNRIWGTLAGGKLGGETLTLDGARSRFADSRDAGAQTLLESFRGYYTVSLPAFDGVCTDTAPLGVGYLAVTVGAKGSAKIAGVLADGTKVTQASRLILFDGCGPEACVPFFVPLYAKRGWAGGLLWIAPNRGKVVTDRDLGWFIHWENPSTGPDGLSMLLDACGGFYGTGTALAAAYAFTADAAYVPYHYPDGWQDPVVAPDGVPVAAAGGRMTIVKGVKPRKVTEDGDIRYEYDEANPANATLTFTARSGIFKGKFSLYYDYDDASGRLVHKAVNVPYAGVLTPVRDGAFAELPAGLGHCLVPESDPYLKAYKFKRSCPVWLETGD